MTQASKSVYEPGSSAVTGAWGSASGVIRKLPLVHFVNSVSNLSSGSSNVSTTLLMMSSGMVQAYSQIARSVSARFAESKQPRKRIHGNLRTRGHKARAPVRRTFLGGRDSFGDRARAARFRRERLVRLGTSRRQ